jgi:nicotinamide mononucleotide transporter
MSTLEVTANAVMTLSILLAGRNSVHTWWTGIVGCALFGVLFTRTQLYADAALQGFFMVTSAIGWRQWASGNHGAELTVGRTHGRELAWAIPLGLAATLAYAAMLHRLTDAYAPLVDSAVLVFSVLAQCLLMRRKIETWPFWLVVNSIAMPLYLSRGLHLTAFLYGCYWLNAIAAWRHWSRHLGRNAYDAGR